MSLIRPEVVASSVSATLELLTCCVLGVIGAKRGVLDPAGVSSLSKIVYNIFLPSLLLTNVARTVVSQPLRTLLPIPAMAMAQIAIGLLVSVVVMAVFRIDRNTDAGRECQICCAFGNSGILPLLFVNALFRNHPDPTVLTRAVAYISFFLMGWSPTFWTFGHGILIGGEEAAAETSGGGSGGGGSSSGGDGFFSGARQRLSALGERILSPPIVACFAGLVIGICRPLRALLMPPAAEGAAGGAAAALSAPLGPLWSALTILAAAYTPSGILVLAGSLAHGPSRGKGAATPPAAVARKLAVVAVARWLLVPAAVAAALPVAVKAGLLPNDPLLLFVLLMQSCMPSAQNSVLILQVAGLRDAAGRMARTLCAVYLLSILPVSALLTAFLHVLQIA